jgi:hypothetical protein
MKRTLILAIVASCAVFIVKCRKARPSDQDISSSSIHEAREFFDKQTVIANNDASLTPRISSTKSPIWDSARLISTNAGTAVVVPVRYTQSFHIRSTLSGRKLFDLNELAHLLIYRDNHQQFHAELVTAFPDSTLLLSNSTVFSGIIFVEDWGGNLLKQYKYEPNGTIFESDPPRGQTGKSSSVEMASSLPVTPTIAMTTCYEITGYNYSPDDPDNGYSWSEPAGCISTYYPVSQPLASIGSPSPSNYGSIPGAGQSAITVSIAPPDAPIDDIQAYFRCFTNSSAIDHTYSVTVCVQQPAPGSRSPWSFTSGGSAGSSAAHNPFNAGHTFLVLSENNAGNVITRNVGFYPIGIVNPYYPSDQGVLDDNEKSPYDISVTFNVTNNEFFSMLNYVEIGNNPGYLYNLNTNNCTTFVIHTLAAGDITLSSTQGSWPGGGHGYDPGDIGEDIRSMSLPPNASRNTVQNPHPNQGSCN